MIKRDFSLNNPKEIERRKKISKTMKRISSSPEWRIMMSERLKGENNPNYGKPLLKEHRKKLSEAHKGKMSDWQKGEKAYW